MAGIGNSYVRGKGGANLMPFSWILFFSSLNPNLQVTGIHIHCVAGLGRAPVLVGIALVEVQYNRCVPSL